MDLPRAALLASVSLAFVVAGCAPSGGHDHAGSTGLSANSLLTAAEPTLRIELDHVADHVPGTAALALLRQRATERCDKPGGVELLVDERFARRPSAGETAPRPWSLAELQTFETAHRRPGTTVYVLLVDGPGDPALGASPLGWAYGSSSIAVFADALRDAAPISGGDPDGWVLVHELGHLLGLVGHGTPQVTQHEDMIRRGHCKERGCVMRFSADARADDFCPRCKEDLAAAGGRR
jgi:hypothetical protein